MDSPKRFSYAMVGLLAAALAASLVAIACAAPRDLLISPALAGVDSGSLPGRPIVPVAVTLARSFTITGSIGPGHSDEVTLTCYRRNLGAWIPVRSVAASVTTPAAGARFSAKVSLPEAGTWVIRAETKSPSTDAPSFSATSTAIRVSAKADAIVWNRDGVLTLAERMRYRSDARQLVVVTARSLASHSGTMTVYEYRSGDWVELLHSPCRLGRNGLCEGSERRRGNDKTPTGIWMMPGFVFGQHAVKPSGTKLAYRHITTNHWWSSEKGSQYNTWVWSRHYVDGEHLIDYATAYEYALSSGFNAKPNRSVYGRGTGIFLHVWLERTTAGCVSVPRATMQRVFRTMDPAKRRVFVVGTLGQSDPTRVDLY